MEAVVLRRSLAIAAAVAVACLVAAFTADASSARADRGAMPRPFCRGVVVTQSMGENGERKFRGVWELDPYDEGVGGGDSPRNRLARAIPRRFATCIWDIRVGLGVDVYATLPPVRSSRAKGRTVCRAVSATVRRARLPMYDSVSVFALHARPKNAGGIAAAISLSGLYLLAGCGTHRWVG